MSARGPALVALAVALTGAVVATEGPDETPAATQASARAGVDMPALADHDVLASTWYCAAGTAAEDGMADHTVVVFNPGDTEVRGTLTVRTGGLMAPPAASELTERADEMQADDESAAPAGGAGGPVGLAEGEVAAPARPSQDEGDEGDQRQGGDGGDEGDDGGASVGDPWEGAEGPGAVPVEEAFTVEPGGRWSVRLGDLAEAPLAAALVEAGAPVVVEHEVAGPTGRDVGPCASSASTEWHLAWGVTTRDAREVLVLFNPFPSVTTVDVVFTTSGGIREPLRYQGLPVPAGGVLGLDIGREVSREEHVSTTVRSRSGPLVVARLQSFEHTSARRPAGLTAALAVPRPQRAWAFTQGVVGDGRREWIVVYNPTDERAEVEVAVRPSGADAPPPTPFGLTVRARGYESLPLDGEERIPAGLSHAVVVRSSNDVPVVSELVMASPATDPEEGAPVGEMTAGPGATLADEAWLFASVGEQEGVTAYLVAYNPDRDRPATVSVTGYAEGEPVVDERRQGLEVAPGGRRAIRLDGDLAEPGLAYVVESEGPVIVERVVDGADGTTQVATPGVVGGDGTIAVEDVDLALGG